MMKNRIVRRCINKHNMGDKRPLEIIMAKIDKVRESGKELVLSMIEKDGMDKTALFFGYVRPDGTGNGGALSNAIKDLGWRDGGERKPVSRKPKGFLPKRVENWAIGKLGLDVADGDLLPDGFGPDDFLALPDVEHDSVNYMRLLSKLCPEKEAPALRAWLGCGLTRDEREQERLDALTKGVNGKIGKSLKTALSLAETLESPEMALAIAALMARFGFQTESE
jgi:hypothetical protein